MASPENAGDLSQTSVAAVQAALEAIYATDFDALKDVPAEEDKVLRAFGSSEQWASSKLAAPAPAPQPFTLLFVGVNSDVEPDLRLGEEHERVQAALDAAFGRASVPEHVVLKHVAYSTWNEVMDEIRRARPTWLHFGCHADQEAGIQLFRNTVQPEQMLPAIKAWNEHAGQNGWAQLRVIVVNACESAGHAENFFITKGRSRSEHACSSTSTGRGQQPF